MDYGFIKAAACSPEVIVADPGANAEAVIARIAESVAAGARIAVFPELALTGNSCGDLLRQRALLDAAEASLARIVSATAGSEIFVVVGLPLRREGRIYNVAAAVANGRISGVVPKSWISGNGDVFASGQGMGGTARILGEEVPFGTDLLFRCVELPALTIGIEIGDDAELPVPPSIAAAAAGATVLANSSACPEVVGKAGARRAFLRAVSARLQAGYISAEAGFGESTTDAVFSGQDLIAENGEILAESEPFGAGFAVSELDLELILNERRRTRRPDVAGERNFRMVPFSLTKRRTALTRRFSATPFVPDDDAELAARCETIFAIQRTGLATRLERARVHSAVLGISGGLDSTLALLVAARAMKALDWPMSRIVAVTMPGFGTTARTKSNAVKMCEAIGATVREIPIGSAVWRHFEDLGHDPNNHSLLYENAQARERTQILMDVCHQVDGLVVGTGDLSELALGWATYNGDHMSMYGVNGGVPKTLVRCLVRHAAATTENGALKAVLFDVLDTPVSPELLPSAGGTTTQLTESILGSYELHDFYLYMTVRRGFSPRKTLYLAERAFAGRADRARLRGTLTTFLKRFFTNQFKRSCLPDGPKVGSVGLSPRGDWRMPSDAAVQVWLDDLAREDELD